jgi:LmbE family N-acetylglucosaminyl deacetylase
MPEPTTRRAQRLSELETILRWDAHKDHVRCFTASPAVRRKLERAGYRPTRRSTVKGREVGWDFTVPYADLRWGARPRKTGPTPGSFRASRGSWRPLALAQPGGEEIPG